MILLHVGRDFGVEQLPAEVGVAEAFTSGAGVFSLRTGASDGGDAISVVSLAVEDFSGFAFLPCTGIACMAICLNAIGFTLSKAFFLLTPSSVADKVSACLR